MSEEEKFSNSEKVNNKKGSMVRFVSLVVIGLLLVVSILMGVSYAFWKSTTSQKSTNRLVSSCLDISITDVKENNVTTAINLQNAYPLTDAEAANLTPYQFTITNTCTANVTFNVNLEVMGVSNKLNNNYVAMSFNGGAKELLGSKTTVTPTYNESDYTATEAYNLISNVTLNEGENKTYTLKLWLDQSVTAQDAMSKRFLSKISVTGELLPE